MSYLSVKPINRLKKALFISDCLVNTRSFAVAFSVALFCFSMGYAQKKPLDHDVYDDWESVGTREMSPNGNWMLYSINPQEGDKTLYIQQAQSSSPLQKIGRAERPAITYNSNYAVFLIKPFYKEIKEHRVQKNKKGKKEKKELTKDSLGIYSYQKNSLHKIPEVTGYKLPKKNGSYIAYVQEVKKDEEAREEEASKDTTVVAQKDSADTKEEGKRLVLRRLSDGRETVFSEVDQYAFSEDGTKLVYTVKRYPKKEKDKKEDTEKEEETENETSEEAKEDVPAGVFLVNTSSGAVQPILEAEGAYTRLQISEDGHKLAFIGTHDEKDEDVKDYKLYTYDFSKQHLDSITSATSGIAEGLVISENYTPNFSKDGKKLFLGIAPEKEPKDTTFIEEDHAVLDLWHYKDDYLQPQQLVNLKKDLEKSFLSVVDADQPDKLIQLQDEKMNFARTVDEGNADLVFAMSDYGHRVELQWDVSGIRTYFLIDTKTGTKKEIIKDLNGTAYVGPKGQNVVFYDYPTQNWYAYSVATEKITHLNEGLSVSFADEQNDVPADPGPYGIAGWTDGEESVLIYDRYDIWEFFLKGNKAPRMLTQGVGRAEELDFRYLRLDPEERTIARNKAIILSAFNENNKESGFYETIIRNNRKPKKLVMEPMAGHRSLAKAKNAENYHFVHHSFAIPPTLVSTSNFKNFTELHQSNPQQKDYNWGTVELIEYTALNGKPATGMLFKPEDFDESQKYPLLVYFYERRSDALHNYEPPAPTPSRLNITYFVSNRYVVFVPDIIYTRGHPGRSAEEYIDGGIDHLIANYDWINAEKVGIQGQSWGGYQVAHLITRSNRYAAAWSGAPVVNMTSAYGGIRWASGMNRQFQYEKTQSRIGKTLWEDVDLYLENSPLFHMENVTTPVAIMHNDNDGAVPWYQGIEMFTALRRLGKPVWLLNYNGDEHNLMKRQNRKDIQRREQQFFDHYLKDEPAPVWMVEGIPAVKKGKVWGFELTDEKP